MPDRKDFAALPTNWALTLWDAAPLFFSLEAAFAILVVTLFTGSLRSTIWRRRRIASPGGFAVLALTSLTLALFYAITALLAALLLHNLRRSVTPDGGSPGTQRAPDSPFKAMTAHLGEAVVPVLLAAAMAAFVKVVLDPSTDWPGLIWIVLAVPAALALPGGPGPAAIAAGGFSFSPGGLAAAAALIVTSTIAALLRESSERLKSSAQGPAEA